MEPSQSDFEELLRRSRPEPRVEFVRELEGNLLRSLRPRARRSRRRLPRLLPVAAFVGAMASLVLVLSVAGVLPLGIGGATGAQAERHCVTVTEMRTERTPVLRTLPSGRLQLSYRTLRVPSSFIRCR